MIIAAFIWFLFPADSIQTVIAQSSQQMFRTAVSLSSAADGTLFVVDQAANALYEISKENSVTKTIGGQGWGNDAFDLPTDVTSSFLLDIYVVDANNRRVQRYDKQFNYAQTYDEQIVPSISGRFQPTAAATSIQGELFILDKDGKRVIVLSPRGQFSREFGSFNESAGKLTDPRDIAVSAHNEVFVLDRNAVMVFDSFGNYLKRIPLSPAEEWRAINVTRNSVIVTASSRIDVVALDAMTSTAILPQSIMGATVTEHFTDALMQDSTIIILTKTMLYRCVFP